MSVSLRVVNAVSRFVTSGEAEGAREAELSLWRLHFEEEARHKSARALIGHAVLSGARHLLWRLTAKSQQGTPIRPGLFLFLAGIAAVAIPNSPAHTAGPVVAWGTAALALLAGLLCGSEPLLPTRPALRRLAWIILAVGAAAAAGYYAVAPVVEAHRVSAAGLAMMLPAGFLRVVAPSVGREVATWTILGFGLGFLSAGNLVAAYQLPTASSAVSVLLFWIEANAALACIRCANRITRESTASHES